MFKRNKLAFFIFPNLVSKIFYLFRIRFINLSYKRKKKSIQVINYTLS